MLDEPAPEFELQDINGKVYSLVQFKGKIVVLHFAASWCPFCTEEAPHLENLFQKYKSQGVQVLLIDVMEPKHVAATFQQMNNYSFPVLIDTDGEITKKFAPEGVMPEIAREEVPVASNLIIDENGIIRFYSLLDTENFDAELITLQEKLNELLEAI
jgi:peroxiredoxin